MAALPRYQPGRTAEDARADHGVHDAVKLASNEMPFGPLPGVAEAVAGAMASSQRYADHTASAVAAAYAECIGVARPRIAVGPGSVGLLQQLALAYAGPGDEVVHPWPSFIAYPQFTRLAGATDVAVPLRRHTVDVDALLAAVTPRTRVLVLAHPNNPTSTALRSDELRRLVDGVPDSCLVVVDEAYREFVTGADVPDALEHLAERPNVVVLRTLSKAYGLAGLRIGFAIAHPDVVAALDACLIPFAVSAAAQAGALAALACADVVAERCGRVTSERDRVAQVLRRARLGVPASQGNFWWLPAGHRSAPLAVALERRGVVTRPFPDGVRVTVGRRADNQRFVVALAGVLAADPSLGDAWTIATGACARAAADRIDRLSSGAGRNDGWRRQADRETARVAEMSDEDWRRQPSHRRLSA